MNEYQKRMKAAFTKMEEIRKAAEKEKRAMTAEEIETRKTLKAEIDAIEAEMKSVQEEEELRKKMFGDDDSRASTVDNLPDGQIAIPDAPIYRGSGASMLGQQLMDIRAIYKHGVSENEKRDAKSRLEKVYRRAEERAEIRATKEGKSPEEVRAAATGGFTVGVEGGQFLQGNRAYDPRVQ
jgi:hypothetical protein